ncbi:hypothetical protein DPEC_G00275550 [Dallia pectoralis]|uniref:Uncharacterized protein n=1 Tax=Dallia pectoralis TaxID=75939 RepID=A0ACC2FLP0_DALPE|nr:hypothetical protein DPEC_G00275550 [Dallia pectoralis]
MYSSKCPRVTEINGNIQRGSEAKGNLLLLRGSLQLRGGRWGLDPQHAVFSQGAGQSCQVQVSRQVDLLNETFLLR